MPAVADAFSRKDYGDTIVSDQGDFVETTQAAGQAAAGWYFAQGDPPGTERYWNGTEWEGAYRAVGGFSPTEVVTPAVFPSWAKVVAWVLTILKAIPLLLMLVLLAAWTALTEQLRDEADFDLRDLTVVVGVVIGIVVLIGFVLLVGQLVSVMKERPGTAAIWGGILTALDAIAAIGSFADGGEGGGALVIVVFLAQAGLFAMMVKLWNDRRSQAA